MDFYVGQIFKNDYPPEAVLWCDKRGYYIKTISDDVFQISEQEPYIPTQEDIDKLKMTAWDFVNVLKQAGLNSNQIMMFLNSNPDIQLHLTCCKDVYCGVAKSLMPITYEGKTITKEMVEKAFRDKHGV